MSKITYPTFQLQKPSNPDRYIEQVLQNAIELHRAGQFDQAEQYYRQVLQSQPRHAYTLNMLGVLNSQRRNYREGEKLIKKAIKADPGVADYHCNLGQCLQEQGKLQEAGSVFRKALDIDACCIPALFGLGNVSLELKKPEQAIEYFRKTIEIEPRFLPACNNLGNVYRELKMYDEALDMFNKVIALKPDFAEAWYNLGLLHYINLDGKNALKAFNKAIELRPDHARAILKLADTYGLLLNDLDSARTRFDHLLELNPDHFQAYLHKAIVYQAFGEFGEAEKILRKAMEIDDSSITVFQRLITSKTYNDEDISRVKSLLSELDIDEEQLVKINFALGNSYEDRKEFETAFRYYHQANQLHRSSFRYDPEAYKRHISEIIETFDAGFIAQYSQYGLQTDQMLFIVGMPRSGTTLTEQIIASHPDVYGGSEPDYMQQAFRKFAELFATGEVTGVENAGRRVVSGEDIRKIASEYLAQISPDKVFQRITDKTPRNFIYIGLIGILFPNARIIHCRRNPVDTCLSIYFQHFQSHHPYAYDLGEIGQDYRQYLRLMEHWHALGDRQILEVRYEELVQNTEEYARMLTDFAGIPWNDACLDFAESERAVRTASQWQVRQKVYTASIDRWRQYEKWITPLIEALGDDVRYT